MNYKKQIGILGGVMLVVISGITYLDNYTGTGLCDFSVIKGIDYLNCFLDLSIDYVGMVSLSVFVILFFLFFTKEGVYLAWRKFALWYIPITLLITVASSTTSQGGSFSGMMPSDREFVSYFFPIVFAFISLILIIYKSLKLRGK
jgi:hypothetical protein